MLDGFSTITDADLAAMHAQQLLPRSSLINEAPRKNLTHELFQYDKYDWSDWQNSKMGYVPLVLTRNYFTFVDTDRYDEITTTFSHYCANVQLNKETGEISKIYAVVGGNGNPYTYLHRHIAGATDRRQIVDHKYGLTLDNREDLVKSGSILRNVVNHDSSGRRTTNPGLKRGVYEVSGGKYKAQIKRKGVTYRSDEVFDTEDAAHEWYRRKFKHLFRFEYVELSTASPTGPVGIPLFPPLKGSGTNIPF